MLKQQLSQKQQQKLSPLQIQQIKLLELNGLEIEERINQELEENPALEEAVEDADLKDNDVDADDSSQDISQEEMALGDYRTEEDIPDYRLQQIYNNSKDSPRESIPYSESESLTEHLLGQLHLKNLSGDDLKVAEYLIGNLDEDGYLRRNLQAISDDLLFQYNLDFPVARIKKVLAVIKELDPPGIGASDLQECLLLQLDRKEETDIRSLTKKILKLYFGFFSRKQYDKLLRTMNISEEDLKAVIKEVTQLDPRPGRAWESNMETKLSQITPDFTVEAINDELAFSMQDQYIPNLRVNPEYMQMLLDHNKERRNAQQREAISFVKQKVDTAQWFIDAIRQRMITLKHTMLAIIDIQYKFFLSGDETDLKPMILKNVAEKTGYDISTISRVISSKYVQTNFGIYPLKYFFSESMTNEEGEEISTREIKAILKKCIDEEDKTQPLTDEALGKKLKEQGYDIARRTVAKYREQLNIPIARLRKEI